jgi:hypothetical protein
VAFYRGLDGFLSLGGVLVGAPRTATSYASAIATININSAATLTGIVAIGDIFTVAGETGTPNHTVTGGPFYVAATNSISNITFTPAFITGGVGSSAVVTFQSNAVANVKAHNINATVETLDSTVMLDKWKTFKGGVAKWTGSGDCFLDGGDARQLAIIQKLQQATPATTISAILFGAIAGKQWYAACELSEVRVTGGTGALWSVAFSFEGSGSLLPNFT